jgi:hypothetical protein
MKVTTYIVFQDKEKLEDFLEGANSNLNRELLELYRIITDSNTNNNLLHIMNKTWYIAKWVFMQKEPKLLLFDRELKQFMEDTSDSNCEEKKYAMLLAYYILKRQKTLPAKISEFLPEIEKVYISYYEQYDPFEIDVVIAKMSDFLKSHNDFGYNTNLYLEINSFYPKDIKEFTNNFNLNDIKKILPYYGNINQQLRFIACVEKTIAANDSDNLPF